jgi:hypothetical protein
MEFGGVVFLPGVLPGLIWHTTLSSSSPPLSLAFRAWRTGNGRMGDHKAKQPTDPAQRDIVWVMEEACFAFLDHASSMD